MDLRFNAAIMLACLLLGCSPVGPKVSVGQQAQVQDLINRGTYMIRTGQIEQAKATFEVALQTAPVPEAIDGLGCVAFLDEDFELAEALFLKTIRLYPSYMTALANLALVYEVTGRKHEAQALYEQAIDKSPRNLHVRSNFGALLFDLYSVGVISKAQARNELLRAQALGNHPIIERDLKILDESL